MKLSIVTLSMAFALATVSAQAANPLSQKNKTPEVASTQSTFTPSASLFDHYTLVDNFVAVSSAVPTADEAVSELGTQRIVKAATVQRDGLIANRVVRNTMTDELGIMTGRVSVMTSDQSALEQASRQLNLQLVKRLPSGKVVMFKASNGTDLLALKQQLEAIPGVKQVRLDVLEKRYEAQ